MSGSIGFLGTGLMGRPMVERLLASGFGVHAWNRTLSKAEPLRDKGAVVRLRAADAIAGAQILCVILENAAVVDEVLLAPEALSSFSPGAVVVDMTSLHPDAAKRNAQRLAEIGVAYLDAPVSGGPSGAADGTLAIMVGGTSDAFAKAYPVLERFGRPSLVGPSGSGQITKLGSQMIASCALAAVAETLLLFTENGVAVDRARQALFSGFADSKILRIHGERMIRRDFVPGGHVRTFLKDLDAAADIAARSGLNLAIARTTRDLFARLDEQGHGDDDIAAIALAIEQRNEGCRITAGPDENA